MRKQTPAKRRQYVADQDRERRAGEEHAAAAREQRACTCLLCRRATVPRSEQR
jgi:hypothetical protein